MILPSHMILPSTFGECGEGEKLVIVFLVFNTCGLQNSTTSAEKFIDKCMKNKNIDFMRCSTVTILKLNRLPNILRLTSLIHK